MTYAEQFLSDRYAQTATKIGHSHRQTAQWMHETALMLQCKNAERLQLKGKPMSDDHLKQEAVKCVQQR